MKWTRYCCRRVRIRSKLIIFDPYIYVVKIVIENIYVRLYEHLSMYARGRRAIVALFQNGGAFRLLVRRLDRCPAPISIRFGRS